MGTAIVTGAAGQDGYYLVRRLAAEGVHVHAVIRARGSASGIDRIAGPGSVTVHELDINDAPGHERLLAQVRPDEFYNLAGLSSVSASFLEPNTTWRTNADAVQALLEAVRTVSPLTRFYQSSSTEMFGAEPGEAITNDEGSRFMPQSPYAAAKAAAHLACDAYRRTYGLRTAAGILSNHESRRRAPGFLTRKVVDHVRMLRRLGTDHLDDVAPLAVGNLAARRDWGFAPDYVDGMVRVIRQIEVRARTLRLPADADVGASYRDYVLGSGRLHAVWQLVDRAFALAGLALDWDRSDPDPASWAATFRTTGGPAIVVDPTFIRPTDPAAIRADPAKARRELGWRPPTGLDRFLADMLDASDDELATHR
ncbi:MAG: GDP-mannose 4,6-dehydratase [Chloroflexota bacterium]|nr:MAG: GDP-mannose 4,6-dehydratase [Chloroflexota bacterium]